MLKTILLALALSLSFAINGQSFLDQMDTNYQTSNEEFNKLYWDVFLEKEEANKAFEIKEADPKLLQACIFYIINEFREKGFKEQLRYDAELESTAYNYHQYYGKEYFANLSKNQDLLFSTLRPAAHKVGFTGSYLNLTIANLPVPKHTQISYYNLAKSIVKEWKYYNTNALRSKAFSKLGCYVTVAPNGEIQAMVILGGYRLDAIEEEVGNVRF